MFLYFVRANDLTQYIILMYVPNLNHKPFPSSHTMCQALISSWREKFDAVHPGHGTKCAKCRREKGALMKPSDWELLLIMRNRYVRSSQLDVGISSK